jgi:hydroxyacylglutathione hydrolase
MTLVPLPAFADNYIWMLQDGSNAIVVDPGDARPVLDALASGKLQLAAILVTHHHADHTGGVAELRAATGAAVWGPRHERIPEPYAPLVQGDRAEALGLRFEVIDVPGHTAGHIAYFLPATEGRAPLLFCGDTLFSGGCGRLFEGTPAQMLASLDALAALPGDTHVHCAHEYTLSNIRFALACEPGNAALATWRDDAQALRARGVPTLPTTIAHERAVNPFMRADSDAIRATLEAELHETVPDRLTAFTLMREWKNRFR